MRWREDRVCHVKIHFWGDSSQKLHQWLVVAIFSILWRPLTAVLCLVRASYNLSAALLEESTAVRPPHLPGSSRSGFPIDRASRRPLSYLQQPVSSCQLRAVQPSLKASSLDSQWEDHDGVCVCVCASIRLVLTRLSASKQFASLDDVRPELMWEQRPWHDWAVFLLSLKMMFFIFYHMWTVKTVIT